MSRKNISFSRGEGEPGAGVQLAPPPLIALAMDDVLAIMENGSTFLKYGKHGRPADRIVVLTSDHTQIQWNSKSKSIEDSTIFISEIVQVRVGSNSANFRRHSDTQREERAQYCFSVVYCRIDEELETRIGDAAEELINASLENYAELRRNYLQLCDIERARREDVRFQRTLDLLAPSDYQHGVWIKGLRELALEYRLAADLRREELAAMPKQIHLNEQREGEPGELIEPPIPYSPPSPFVPIDPSANGPISYSPRHHDIALVPFADGPGPAAAAAGGVQLLPPPPMPANLGGEPDQPIVCVPVPVQDGVAAAAPSPAAVDPDAETLVFSISPQPAAPAGPVVPAPKPSNGLQPQPLLADRPPPIVLSPHLPLQPSPLPPHRQQPSLSQLDPVSPPPAPVVNLPDDIDDLIHMACATELDGLPNWDINLKIVSIVSQQSMQENEYLLTHSPLPTYLRSPPSHGSGLLALILFECLYQNCECIAQLSTITRDAAWMRVHFIKVLPRWSRKPLEGPVSAFKCLFLTATDEAALKQRIEEEHDRLALMRWNKIKVIISALANDREIGIHWFEAYVKLKNARAYDDPSALAMPDDALDDDQGGQQNPQPQQFELQQEQVNPYVPPPQYQLRPPRSIPATPIRQPVIAPSPGVIGVSSSASAAAPPALVLPPPSPTAASSLLSHNLAHFNTGMTRIAATTTSLQILLRTPMDSRTPEIETQIRTLIDSLRLDHTALQNSLSRAMGGASPIWITEEQISHMITTNDTITNLLATYEKSSSSVPPSQSLGRSMNFSSNQPSISSQIPTSSVLAPVATLPPQAPTRLRGDSLLQEKKYQEDDESLVSKLSAPQGKSSRRHTPINNAALLKQIDPSLVKPPHNHFVPPSQSASSMIRQPSPSPSSHTPSNDNPGQSDTPRNGTPTPVLLASAVPSANGESIRHVPPAIATFNLRNVPQQQGELVTPSPGNTPMCTPKINGPGAPVLSIPMPLVNLPASHSAAVSVRSDSFFHHHHSNSGQPLTPIDRQPGAAVVPVSVPEPIVPAPAPVVPAAPQNGEHDHDSQSTKKASSISSNSNRGAPLVLV